MEGDVSMTRRREEWWPRELKFQHGTQFNASYPLKPFYFIFIVLEGLYFSLVSFLRFLLLFVVLLLFVLFVL